MTDADNDLRVFELGKTRGRFVCHILRIYIYLIVSPPVIKRINIFQFFYTLILIRQKVYKTLLFLKNSCEMYQPLVNSEQYLDGREKIDSHFRGNDIQRSGNGRSGRDNEDERYKGSNEITALSSKVRNDRSLSRDNKCRGVL